MLRSRASSTIRRSQTPICHSSMAIRSTATRNSSSTPRVDTIAVEVTVNGRPEEVEISRSKTCSITSSIVPGIIAPDTWVNRTLSFKMTIIRINSVQIVFVFGEIFAGMKKVVTVAEQRVDELLNFKGRDEESVLDEASRSGNLR